MEIQTLTHIINKHHVLTMTLKVTNAFSCHTMESRHGHKQPLHLLFSRFSSSFTNLKYFASDNTQGKENINNNCDIIYIIAHM